MSTAARNDLLARTIKATLAHSARTPKQRSLSVLWVASMSLSAPVFAQTAQLPVPCASGSCTGVANFVTSGSATASSTANSLTVNQTTASTTLNWQSFNISRDATVTFNQPDASSIAVNRIFDANASNIMGGLNANGRVYLLNQNGFLFGDGAQVNVGGLVASSLNITQQALDNGIASGNRRLAFQREGAGMPGSVQIDAGAHLRTAEGGEILIFAPTVTNRGDISTPGGQTILAAGERIFLTSGAQPSQDTNRDPVRGLWVEVEVGGTVTNGEVANDARDVRDLVGNILAERGNVTLAGLAVNQLGRVSATTSVRANGSVRLAAQGSGNANVAVENHRRLTLGRNSVTEVTLDGSGGTTVDANVQDRSQIRLIGQTVELLESSQVTATGGNVNLNAVGSSESPLAPRVYLANGSRIDVSGADTELAMERNSLRVELRGSQLADSPEQRNGPLRGQAVYVDIRASGTREDGTTWQGTPVGDLSGDISTIERDVFERNTLGGSIFLGSQDAEVIMAPQAVMDVSGGSIRYRDGNVAVSQVLGADGRLYTMEQADPGRRYIGISSGMTVVDRRWGVTQTYSGGGGQPSQRFESGYVEGKDAGSVHLLGRRAVVDGVIHASVIAGRHQRLPTEPLATGQVFRAFDQVPLGGAFVLGNADYNRDSLFERDLGASDVVFDNRLRLPTLLNSSGGAFDPRFDALPVEVDSILLGPDLLSAGQLARLEVYSNGSITLSEQNSLRLTPGGAVSLTGADIDIAGDISVRGGRIDIMAITNRESPLGALASVNVASTAALDVSGQWVNDSTFLNPTGAFAPLWIDGGSISIETEPGTLNLAAGSLLDVSGGAWHRGNGGVIGGSGGDISMVTRALPQTTDGVAFTLAAELRGYSLTNGGSLSITANDVCIAAQACNGLAGTLWLQPSFLQSGGFSRYSLSSNLRGLTVGSGSQIRLQQTNWELLNVATFARTGTELASITRQTILDDELRRPVSLSLTARISAGPNGDASGFFASASNLVIGTGASIIADPQARISLQSNSRISVDGSIYAPGGFIGIGLNTNLSTTAFLASQAIRLGDGAVLDVSGTTRLVGDDLGRITGSVLNGGTVDIQAERGYVIALQGSRIDVSGTAANVNLDMGRNVEERVVGSNGGVLNIRAAEGAFLSGAIDAGGGTSDNFGGTFNFSLNANGRLSNNDAEANAPRGAREIVLTDVVAPVSFAENIDIPLQLNGQAQLSTTMLEGAGFDSVSLSARTLLTNRGGAGAEAERGGFGRISIDGGVDFSTRASLLLDAPIISLRSGSATVSSSYLFVQNAGLVDAFGQVTPDVLATSAGTLTLRGNFVDVQGNIAVDNAQLLRIESGGDIRFRGIEHRTQDTYFGSLNVAGDLDLQAAQIYPATLTNFVVRTLDTQNGTIRTFGVEGTAQPVLSAAGNLTLEAPTIEHGGVLRAPFGTLNLNASSSLTLLPGSVTSTAATTTIPFGTTQGGFDWAYSTASRTLVYGDANRPVPEQSVRLTSNAIDFQVGATIDVSAGGDLQAYEWIRGVGGTVDWLSAAERPNQYAVIPGTAFAPYDGNIEYQNASLATGTTVYLNAAPGLAAGFYTLMPARYALLPGAFLVTAVNGYQDLAPGASFTRPDGGTVVSGYYSFAGTDIRESRTRGFVVRPGADIQHEARYDISQAGDFFARQAVEDSTPRPRLASDAGRVAFSALNSLNLSGTLLANTTNNGRGAAIDLSSGQLRLTNTSAVTNDGFVNVDVARLAQLNAESIFIGGTRSTQISGTRLDVTAQRVEVAAGTVLEAPEILLSARDTVQVGEAAHLRAQGDIAAAPETLLLNGDSALLRVSVANQVTVQRDANTSPGITGTLDVRSSAQLSAAQGSITADVSRDTLSLGQLALQDGSLSVGASHISFGTPAAPVSGLLLDDSQFDSLGLNELVLNSRSTLDFYGGVELNADRLVINSYGLRSGDNSDVAIAATQVLLTNNSTREATAVSGSGRLAITADQIQLGSGQFELSGFATSNLAATGQLMAVADGRLEAAGALTLSAPRVTGAAGVAYATESSGAMTIASTGAAPTTLAPLGTRLTFTADSIAHSGRIDAPSGVVELVAIGAGGDVALTGSGAIAVAGSPSVFDGVTVSAPAGSIRLSSLSGDVSAAAGTTLDVQASGNGAAGRLAAIAPQGDLQLGGTILGAAQESSRSGEFLADARNLGDLSALNQSLAAGGFFAQRSLRQRGVGDLTLNGEWRAHELAVTADQGSIFVNGSIDGSGVEAGTAVLSARDDVVVSGLIDLAASGAGERGGRLELRSTGGGVSLESASIIDVGAGAQAGPDAPQLGTVHIRVGRDAVNTVLDADPQNDDLRLAGTITDARSVTIEGYSATDSTLANRDQLLADATAFITSADVVLTALGHAADTRYRVVPGIELVSTGDMTFSSDWDLSTWRFGNDLPGVLTMRAGGNLTMAASLSDGFVGLTGFTPFAQGRESWSYRIAAGADLASSDVLAVLPSAALGNGGNFSMVPGTATSRRVIRTGTGRIDIAAGGDFLLSTVVTNQHSVIYTAGTVGPGIVLNLRNNQGGFGPNGLQYPIAGGDIDIFAQGDAQGVRTNQLVTDWLWRMGTRVGATGANPTSTAWTVNFQQFAQNIGALGGGNVDIEAGGDIVNLSVSLPSIGRQVGGRSAAENRVEVAGGGDLSVHARGSVRDGSFYVGRGVGSIQAEDAIGATSAADSLAPVLALGDGQFLVHGRSGATIEAIVNPTLLPHGSSQQVGVFRSYFSTYAADSGVSLSSSAGDVRLATTDDALRIAGRYSSAPFFGNGELLKGLQVYSPNLQAVALSGDIRIANSFYLFPAADGDLELFASRNVLLQPVSTGASGLLVVMSDADPGLLASPILPLRENEFANVTNPNLISTMTILTQPTVRGFHAATPLHVGESGVAEDPVRIVARSGSVLAPEIFSTSQIHLPKHARIVAGLDIVGLPLSGQNLDGADITSIIAGRDIRYTLSRNDFGQVASNVGSFHHIDLAGPGHLELRAGRNVDLQTSRGITTDGATRNPALQSSGASVSIIAGLAGRQPDVDAFTAAYLQNGTLYDESLAEFVAVRNGATGLDRQQVLDAFRALSEDEQLAFVETAFFSELRASGRYAADADPVKNGDFSRGFAAMEALFPGSNPNLDGGEANEYSGDIRLFFSRVYTLSGGDINLFAPGGQIDVGLASPPASFGLNKSPSELGLVVRQTGDINVFAFRDLQVNESRMFASDGGNILVWSTRGDIDAGRGAKTAISAPPPIIVIDENGQVKLEFPPALTGSGIQTLVSTPGRKKGNVDLFAPDGVVNASDAGIVAGNLTIAATAVLGADNIQVSGVAVGVPVDTGGLGASLAGVSAAASSASNTATADVAQAARDDAKTPLSQSALSWLEVFVVGLGEENCAQADLECLKRQKSSPQ